MPVQLYLSPQELHTGDDGSEYTWNYLNNLIDTGAGDWFDEIDHPARKVSICILTASDATIDAVNADPKCKKVLPARVADTAAFVSALDTPLRRYPGNWRSAVKTVLLNQGIDIDDLTLDNTLRDVLRRLMRAQALTQRAFGKRKQRILDFVQRNLDETVSVIPVEERDELRDWLQAEGIDITWATGSTTVRELTRYIYERGAFPSRFGGVPF